MCVLIATPYINIMGTANTWNLSLLFHFLWALNVLQWNVYQYVVAFSRGYCLVKSWVWRCVFLPCPAPVVRGAEALYTYIGGTGRDAGFIERYASCFHCLPLKHPATVTLHLTFHEHLRAFQSVDLFSGLIVWEPGHSIYWIQIMSFMRLVCLAGYMQVLLANCA